MKLLLIALALSLLNSQIIFAHEGSLNAVGCHIVARTSKHHCHKEDDFNRHVKKKTSFSGFENRAPVQNRYDVKLVQSIQEQLRIAGYDAGPADGVYGGKTRAAIYAFQRQNEFKVTGKPSEYVLSKLRDFNRLNSTGER